MKVRVEKQIGNYTLSFETGLLAKQAAGAVVAQYGETAVLCAAATGPPRPGIDFFPLMCDYRERMAAGGKFPGGFLKREGRPTTKETLTARLIDRPIRPMFAKGFNDEVQCQAFVLASDKLNDGDVIAMNGVCAALHISPLPFEGPLASVRVGRIDGQLIAFPTTEDLEESDLDLIVSGNLESVLMIEGFAREMPEDDMVDAIIFAHNTIKEICELQNELAEKANVQKMEFTSPADDPFIAELKGKVLADLKTANQVVGKQDRADAVRDLKNRVKAEYFPADDEDVVNQVVDSVTSAVKTFVGASNEEEPLTSERFSKAWGTVNKQAVRELILDGIRSDGRSSTELRNIECHVDVLPRVHGSAVFQRGETQALMTVTLGTARDEQRVDGLMDEYSKKFMLDYNFPSFSVGEVRPIRGPGRREIGHGALAERSVNPVLPNSDKFPYTVRVISDILESNGSSSMASVCGATLSLMAAGVPISNPVAGISVGVVVEGDRHILLTDILGSEDHFGDMDFKIAGTQRGITGIQLDLKIKGISEEIIRDTLKQSREARIEILRTMLTTIRKPRDEISAHAPRVLQTRIDPDKIGMLIGPGGKNIRGIQETTGAVIEVDDDGTVTIASPNKEWADAALSSVEACTATVQIGKIYDGRVTSIKDFGAFVEILPGRDGLCHISELSEGYVSSVSEFFKIGDEMKVVVIQVDEHNRVKLSRRKALEELGEEDTVIPADSGEGEGGGRSDSGGGRGDREGGGGRNGGGRGRGRSGGGRGRGGDRGDRR